MPLLHRTASRTGRPAALVLAVTLLVFATGPVREAVASDRPALSLESAVFAALENNPSLAVERLRPVIAGSFEALAQARFDPRLVASLTTEGGRTDTTTSNGQQIEAGVEQQFASGTTLAASIAGTRSDREGDSDSETRLGLSLTQPLLQGSGDTVNLAQLRQAELDTAISIHGLRGFTEALVAEVENVYWEAALAAARVGIFEEGLRVAERQLDDTRRRIAAGQVAETQEAAPRAEVARRYQGLIDARAERDTRLLDLLRLTGGEWTDWPLTVELPTPVSDRDERMDPGIASIDALVERALTVRPDINEARLQAQRGDLELVRTRDGLLPKLDLFVRLGKSGYAERMGSSVTELGGDGYDYAAGLRFELPLGRRDASARLARAQADRRQADAALRNFERLAEVDVRKAWIEAERSRQQLEASAETRALEDEVLRAEEARFRAGTATALDVALAQRAVIEARLGEQEARVRFRQAWIDLRLQSGSLLNHRGIRMAGEQPIMGID